ncbi:MAG: hypothetical protein JO250_15875 [Armatimonadetes bacterium]|nr:hypothetical protein [Armatimonadota bacterium]
MRKTTWAWVSPLALLAALALAGCGGGGGGGGGGSSSPSSSSLPPIVTNVGASIPETGANPPATAAPFTGSSTGANFSYTVSQSNPATRTIRMTIVLDYAVHTNDLRNITLKIGSGADQIYTFSQIQAGLSVNSSNPNELDFDSSKVPGVIALPDIAPGTNVVLNAYVGTSSGSASTSAVPVQIPDVMPQAGSSQTTYVADFPSRFSFSISNQVLNT